MNNRGRIVALGIGLLATVAQAQTAQPSLSMPATTAPMSADAASASTVAAARAGSGCELHVFPTRNFIATDTGMLSGFGAIGALIDAGAHVDHVKTVKEMMADDLPSEVQLSVLNKADLAATLRMPADTKIIGEESFPNADDIKQNSALKARYEAVLATEKAGKRFTSSTATCYAELVVSYVFYQKAAMYGTRVFTQFGFRDFRNKADGPVISKGQVENHVPDFPAASPDQEAAAKAALVASYGQNLKKWAELKLHKD